mgnify:CR=1 FL=1
MRRIIRRAVGHGSLEIIPDELIGVELRSIAREKVRVQAMVSVQKLFGWSPFVRRPPIPEQDHGAAQMFEQLPEEPGHFRRSDILIAMESGVEGDAPPAGRNADGRDGRNLGPASGATQARSLSPGGPGANDVGDEKKAALIEEYQMGPKFFGFFLYAATGTSSSGRWPSHHAPAPAFPAFDSSNPRSSGSAIDGSGGSRSRNAFRPRQPRGASSKGPWNSRTSQRHAGESRSGSVSVGDSTSEADPTLVWLSIPFHPFCETLRATRTRNSPSSRSWRPLPISSDLLSTERRHAADAFRANPGFHRVASCQNSIVSITYA